MTAVEETMNNEVDNIKKNNEIWKRLDVEKTRQQRIRHQRLSSRSSSSSSAQKQTQNDDFRARSQSPATPPSSNRNKERTNSTPHESPTPKEEKEPSPRQTSPSSSKETTKNASPSRPMSHGDSVPSQRNVPRVSVTSAYKVTSYNKPQTVKKRNTQFQNGRSSPPRSRQSSNLKDDMEAAIEHIRKEQEEEGEPAAEKEEVTMKERKGWLYVTAFVVGLCSTGGLLAIVLFAFGAGKGDIYADTRSKLEYLSPSGVFDLPSSPQRLALDWLVKHDKARIDLDDQRRREARYSLAVLYYSTEGSHRWDDDLQFLSKKHECNWSSKRVPGLGVFCDKDQNIVQMSIGTLRIYLDSTTLLLISCVILNSWTID
jgi:hypothetical protein